MTDKELVLRKIAMMREHLDRALDVPRMWAELPDGLTLLDAYAKAVVTWLG